MDFNHGIPNVDDLWKELDLESLLNRPELIKIPKNKRKNLDPFLKHEKNWQKPTYEVLKKRYQSFPHQPTKYDKKSLERLADPIKGKYTLEKYNEIAGNNGFQNNNSFDNDNNSQNTNEYEEKSATTDNVGFFLTETEASPQKLKNSYNNKYNMKSSYRQRLNEAKIFASEKNDSYHPNIDEKKNQPNNYINQPKNINYKLQWRKKFKTDYDTDIPIDPRKDRIKYRDPAAVVILDNVRSSGYGYGKNKV